MFRLLSIAFAVVVVHAAVAQTAPATQPAAISVRLPDNAALPSSPGYFIVKAQVTAGIESFPLAFGLYLPPAYFKSEEPFPVVMALHNRGGEGDDGRATSFEGFGALCARDDWDSRFFEVKPNQPTPPTRPANAINLRTDARFIAVAPQCPRGKVFTEAPMPQIMSELLSQVEERYRTDKQRVYLTGFSYGGTCTWSVAEQLPERFAAIVPISTRATDDPAKTAKALKDVSVYTGCGTNEWALGFVRQMRDAFVASNHERFVFREIPDGTHWSYPLIYTDPEFWNWLFAQRRTVQQ